MTDISEWVSQERDRRTIEEVIKRYFRAFDRETYEDLNALFAPGGELILRGNVIRDPGIDAEKWICEQKRSSALPATPIAGNHYLLQTIIALSGDRASVETQAISCLAMEGDPRRMWVRGLRYFDRFVRVAGYDWRIERRRHALEWLVEADASFVASLADRLAFSTSEILE